MTPFPPIQLLDKVPSDEDSYALQEFLIQSVPIENSYLGYSGRAAYSDLGPHEPRTSVTT